MNFNQDDDIDVYSLCESVYYSCNNDEYDYVLECVNEWIMNRYNDTILLEDIVLNEISSTKIYGVLAKKFVQRFPEYASSKEEFYNKVGLKPQKNGTMTYKDEDNWTPFEVDDHYTDDNGTDFANRIKKAFKKGAAGKDPRVQSFLLYANNLLEVNREKNRLRSVTLHMFPDYNTTGKPIRIAKDKLQAKADENISKYNSNDLAIVIDTSKFSGKVRKTLRKRRFDGYSVNKYSNGKMTVEQRPGFDERNPPKRKVKVDIPPPPKQEDPKPPSPTPLEDKKGKPAQTPPTPPPRPQQQEPPKSNIPVVTSNNNNQSRLSRFTNYMKNNKVKGGLGVVAAGAAIGGSIYAYKRFKNKPRSVIAKRIAALRGVYHKFMINAQRNPQKANVFKRIAAKILSVIDKLLHYLQNKADGR